MVLSMVKYVPRPWFLVSLPTSIGVFVVKRHVSLCVWGYFYTVQGTASIWKLTHGISLHMETASIWKQVAIILAVNVECAQSMSLYSAHLAVLLWTHGNLLLSTSCLEITSVLFTKYHYLTERKWAEIQW